MTVCQGCILFLIGVQLAGVQCYATYAHQDYARDMTTKNKRVVGYVYPADHDRLRQFMAENRCTESKAIALILESYFSNTPVSVPVVRATEAQSSTPIVTPDLVERLAIVEEKLAELSSTPATINQLVEEAIARLEAPGEYVA